MTEANLTPRSQQIWAADLERADRVLDSFMGSGTTGVACAAEVVDFTGIEADPANFEIARSRILAAHGSPEYAAEANTLAPVGAQLSLV